MSLKYYACSLQYWYRHPYKKIGQTICIAAMSAQLLLKTLV